MNEHYEAAAYEDCVLNSSDDYEPYGYLPGEDQAWAQPLPQLQALDLVAQQRNAAFDRVIEAQLLAHSSMVGC
jgi:hypothetical protein